MTGSDTDVPSPEDDSWYHHERSDDPWWNEASWFGFAVPEKNIDAFFYFWHRPNMKLTAGGVAIWDDKGDTRDNCLYHHWYPFNPYPDGGDHFDFRLDNGMSVELLEPLNKYRLQYQSTMCQLDLVWTGALPAELLRLSNSPAEEFGDFHYEQFGHVEGLVVVDGERYAVDCQHYRDRSWGVRRPLRKSPGGGFELGWASTGTAFCSTTFRPDPQAGLDAESIDRPGCGLVVKGGTVARVTDGTRQVVKRGGDGRPLRIVLDLQDELDRTLHAEGTVKSWLKYDDLWFCFWALVDWDDIDGATGYGETQDWLPIDLVRRHQRASLRTGDA